MPGFYYTGKEDHDEERRIDAAMAEAARPPRISLQERLVREKLGNPEAIVAGCMTLEVEHRDGSEEGNLYYYNLRAVYGDGSTWDTRPAHNGFTTKTIAKAEFKAFLADHRAFRIQPEDVKPLALAMGTGDIESAARILKARR